MVVINECMWLMYYFMLGLFRGVTIKLLVRMIERRLRVITIVLENLFGFMFGRSNIEALLLVRRLIEKYKEKMKDLNMVFIDFEIKKTCDRMPRDII